MDAGQRPVAPALSRSAVTWGGLSVGRVAASLDLTLVLRTVTIRVLPDRAGGSVAELVVRRPLTSALSRRPSLSESFLSGFDLNTFPNERTSLIRRSRLLSPTEFRAGAIRMRAIDPARALPAIAFDHLHGVGADRRGRSPSCGSRSVPRLGGDAALPEQEQPGRLRDARGALVAPMLFWSHSLLNVGGRPLQGRLSAGECTLPVLSFRGSRVDGRHPGGLLGPLPPFPRRPGGRGGLDERPRTRPGRRLREGAAS
jgi:hypothetical protein